MPDERRFQDALETLASYVEDVGDDLDERAVRNVLTIRLHDQEFSLRGHRCSRGEERYVVAGHPDLRFASLVYEFSIVDNLARDLPPGTAAAIVDETGETERKRRRRAASTLLDRVPREQMRAFEVACYQRLSGERYETSFTRNGAGSFTSFVVSADVFPYEESFDITAFYDALVPVVSAGARGRRLLGHAVRLDIDPAAPRNATVQCTASLSE